MSKHAEWAKSNRVTSKRLPFAKKYPGAVEPCREILEVMADDASVYLSAADIFRYLIAPEPDGMGLVPGETGPTKPYELENWLRYAFDGLWSKRRCKA